MLAVWGGVLGLIFGVIMNIWFWPFLAGGASGFDQTEGGVWQPGMSVLATLRSYLTFYVVTSLWWDAWRCMGNALLLFFFGGPILRDAPVPQPLPVRHRPGGHCDAPSAGSCRGTVAERLRRGRAHGPWRVRTQLHPTQPAGADLRGGRCRPRVALRCPLD